MQQKMDTFVSTACAKFYLMLGEFRDDQSKDTSEEAVAKRSVNFEQKSRNLSERIRNFVRPGKNGAVEKFDSGNDEQHHDGPSEETKSR